MSTMLSGFDVDLPYSSLSYSYIRCISGPDHLHAIETPQPWLPSSVIHNFYELALSIAIGRLRQRCRTKRDSAREGRRR